MKYNAALPEVFAAGMARRRPRDTLSRKRPAPEAPGAIRRIAFRQFMTVRPVRKNKKHKMHP
jgi:hypothetical protein